MRQSIVVLFVFVAIRCVAHGAPLSVHLRSTLPTPQPVGTAIGWSPYTDHMSKGMHVFRYSVGMHGGPFRVVRDFSQQPDFAWMPELYEHDASVRVTARNNDTKETAEDTVSFRIVARASGSSPVVTPTWHPLIALFSAPPCPEGDQFRVGFRAVGDETVGQTPRQPCRASSSNNVYVAGMRANTEYQMRAEVTGSGSVKEGNWLPFRTGLTDGNFPPVTIGIPRADNSSVSEPVVVYAAASTTGKRPFATDLEGRLIWYLSSVDFVTRMLPGGRLLVLSEGQNSVNTMRRLQLVRELDLLGNVVRETNVGRVAEQLESLGIHSDCKKGGKECVSGFHHEAIRLPNGHTLVVGGLERMMPAGTQGSKEPVDILGDIVVDLDEEFQVTALWNGFDHLDIRRASLQDAKCKEGPGGGGCPPIFLAAEANGWTHGNSLNYIPSAGDFLISLPEQDWVLKVDWKNGKGTGKVLWRLGKDGDFTAKTEDPSPWFSFQHDAGFLPGGSNLLTILDDGHDRHKKDDKANSRGQAWKLDEEKLVASPVLNADLGIYSSAVGSAQALKNGGYSFDLGYINFPDSTWSRTVETGQDGKVLFAIDVHGTNVYRTYRVNDLYSAPGK